MEIFHVVLFIVDVFPLRINFFSSVEVEVNYGPSQYVFFGVLIFSIGITRCTICAISKIIGKGYNILCFHRYFDVMLFFIGNSQWFCISSEFPSAVSQLFLLSLYKSFSTRHINHYRRHQPDQFKCYSMQEDNVNMNVNMNVNIPPHPPHPTPPLHASYMNVITPHPTLPHPTPSRKLHERYYTPPHPTPSPPRGTPAPKGIYIYIYKYVELSICKDAVTMRRCSSSAHMFGLVYFLSW